MSHSVARQRRWRDGPATHGRRRDFSQLLAGRDPGTGRRLLTARGSGGRAVAVPRSRRGTPTRSGPDAEPLFRKWLTTPLPCSTSRRSKGLSPRGGARRSGGRAAVRLERPARTRHPRLSLRGATIDPDGSHFIAEAELQRFEAARAAGPDPAAVAGVGQASDLLSASQAARIAQTRRVA